MKQFHFLFLTFFSIVWSMNVMAFEVDGISYEVLSESDKTAFVTRQSANLEGDIQILSQVSYEGTVYTVTEIGGRAFSDCHKITSVSVPATVKSIGARAFYECGELTSVILSDNITEIGDDAFIRCRKLKDINIPKNLQRLGEYAFVACRSIEELTLPKTLTKIGEGAFYGCQGLRTLTVEAGNPKYLAEDGALFNHDKTTLMLFLAQNDKTHYDVPETVTTIEGAAFYGSKLKSITLPPMLTTIDAEAFVLMEQLESITIPSSVTTIGNGAIGACASLKEIYVSDGVQGIGDAAFSENPSLVKVHLPEGLTRIEGWLFRGCTSLSEVNIPENVNCIGSDVFRDCQSLTEITIPDKVETVGWDAFRGCSALEKITIGRSVTVLAGGTFYGCDKIREVRSYIEEPFNVVDYDDNNGGRCFPEVVTQEAALFVPQGTIERYRNKQGWRDFVTISEASETAIDEMSVHNEAPAIYYNLNGQRLYGKPTKAIYIQNGKKMIAK